MNSWLYERVSAIRFVIVDTITMNLALQKLLFILASIGLGVAIAMLSANIVTGVAVGTFVLCLAVSIRLSRSGQLEVESVGSIFLSFVLTVVLATAITAIYCVLITAQSPGPNRAWFATGIAAAIYGGMLAVVVSAFCGGIAVIVLLIARRQGLLPTVGPVPPR